MCMPPPDDPPGAGQGAPEDDVGELAHGRVCEPRLEVVLGHRHQRGDQDGGAGGVHQPDAGRGLPQQVEAEDVEEHLQHREDPRLDHGHRVQQGADRGRGDHGRGQPAVKGDERRLACPEGVEQEQAGDGGAAVSLEDAPLGELEGAGQVPGPEQGRQQEEERGAEQDAEIDAAAAAGGRGAPVGHQRVGREGQDLVGEEQREQVAREGDRQGGADGNGEEEEEPGLRGLVVAAHVPDRVAGGDDPQAGGDHGEQHAEGLDLEGELDAGKHLHQACPGPFARCHQREQLQHGAEGQDARGPASPPRAGWGGCRSGRSGGRRPAAGRRLRG